MPLSRVILLLHWLQKYNEPFASCSTIITENPLAIKRQVQGAKINAVPVICRFLFPFYPSQIVYFNLLPSLSLLFHLALKIIKVKAHFSQLCGTKILGKILCIDCKIFTPNAPQVLTCLPCPGLEPSYLLPTTSLVQKIPASLKTLHCLSYYSFTVLKLTGFSDSFESKFKQRLEFTTAIVSK